METITKLFIECSCGCDVLVINKWEDEYVFTMYKSFALGFWQRLIQAWKYFRHGEFAGNEIIIEKTDYDKLLDFIIKAKNASEV